MAKNKSSVSNKESYQEIGEFWDSHDSSEITKNTPPVDFQLDSKFGSSENRNKKNTKKKQSFYSRVKKWVIAKPATKAAWTEALAGWVTAIVAIIALIITLLYNSYIIKQNTEVIKTSQESVQIAKDSARIAETSLLYSISPSIKVTFPPLLQSLNVQIQNTSPYSLNEISFYAVKYKISNGKIINRTQPSLVFSESENENLKPRRIISLDVSKVFQSVPFEDYNKGNFFSLVMVFHREIDNKRFVKIEPFIAALGDDKNFYIFDLQYDNRQDYDGEPENMIKILSEIQRIERIFFRVDDN